MATGRLIPGYGFVVETTTTGRLVPGYGFVVETESTGQTLTPSLFTNTQTFYSPTVTTGAVTLLPALYTNQQTFYSPTITQTSAQTLLPDLFVNQSTFFSPSIFNYSLYPDPSDVREGVRYGPGGIYTGTLTGGGGSTIIRLRSFTERH